MNTKRHKKTRQTPSRRISGLLLALLLCAPALIAAECNTDIDAPPDGKSGTDKNREGATEVSLNVTIVDNVDLVRQDKTDWKYFTVPTAGVVEIVISFDNPKAYGELVVHDEVGQIVSTFADERKHLLDKITFKSEAGKYYMHIWANSEGSDYSIQVNYSVL